jgi:diguanylate cyclase (GGDEF)-like protein
MSRARKDRLRQAAPFAAASYLPLVLLPLPLPGTTWNPLLLSAAMLGMTALWAHVVLVPRDRLPRALGVATGLAYCALIALLRHAGGGNGSGLGAMVILPVMWFALNGRALELWSAVVGAAAVIWIPIVLDHGGSRYPASGWRAGTVMLAISAIVGVTVQQLRLRAEAQARLLSELAHTDELTGLPNRRAWERMMDSVALADSAGGSTAWCVAVVDLDGFKEFNDANGHQAGDRLLRTAAAEWRAQLRHSDILVRLGGDEFAVLMPDTDAAAARAVLERLTTFTPADCSIGVAQRDTDESASAVVRRADLALYAAKGDGRGRIAVAA